MVRILLRKGRKKENVIKWLAIIFLGSSPWPGSNPFCCPLLFLCICPPYSVSPTPFLAWNPLRPSPFFPPSWVFSAHATFKISSRLQFYYMHLIVLTKTQAQLFLQPNFIAPRGWKLCHIYFVCLPSRPPSRYPLKHNQANTCWMTKTFQYFYRWSITFFHLTLQVQKYIGKSHISKYSLPNNTDLSFLKLAITEPNFSDFPNKKEGISTQRSICYVTA